MKHPKRKGSSSNHHFSEVMFNFKGVHVGGFNPFEKYDRQIGKSSPIFGVKIQKKMEKPPPRVHETWACWLLQRQLPMKSGSITVSSPGAVGHLELIGSMLSLKPWYLIERVLKKERQPLGGPPHSVSTLR